MAETKVGISNVDRPAPLWYRRLSNALIIFIIPGAVALVQGWGLSDKQTNRWLLVLAFLPALIKGIGVLLGNGQNYTSQLKVWAVVAVAMFLFGCKTPEQLATERARRQARADSATRAQRMVVLEQTRKALPCIPLKIIEGRTVYLPGDSIPCPPDGKCPPAGVRVDTLEVLDMAAVQAVRDSLDQSVYLHGLKDEHILSLQAAVTTHVKRADKADSAAKYWRGRFWWLTGGITAILGLWLAFSGKFSFISGIIKRIFK